MPARSWQGCSAVLYDLLLLFAACNSQLADARHLKTTVTQSGGCTSGHSGIARCCSPLPIASNHVTGLGASF